MLEIPAVELRQRVEEEIQQNPLLEEVPEYEKKNDDLTNSSQDEYEDDYLYQDDPQEEDYDSFGEPDENYRAANDSVDLNDAYAAGAFDDEYDIPDYRTETHNYSADDDPRGEEIPFSVGNTFHEYLLEQIGERPLSEKERSIAEYVVGSIDETTPYYEITPVEPDQVLRDLVAIFHPELLPNHEPKFYRLLKE